MSSDILLEAVWHVQHVYISFVEHLGSVLKSRVSSGASKQIDDPIFDSIKLYSIRTLQDVRGKLARVADPNLEDLINRLGIAALVFISYDSTRCYTENF